MSQAKRIVTTVAPAAAVVALLVGVSLLPPDTTLKDIKALGSVRACVPTTYAPLVTGNPDLPGIDVEILSQVAERLGVRLVLSPNAEMGRDFNPRNWNLNRAKCQIVAGGVVASDQTRSFLETSPSYADTGWAIVSPEPLDGLSGKTLGALTLVSGLDRIGLSSFLRQQRASVRVVPSEDAFVNNIADGTFDGGVTETLLAGQIASENGWNVSLAPPELARYPLVLGLWKGDLTLKREVDATLHEMESDGRLEAIMQRYGVSKVTAN